MRRKMMEGFYLGKGDGRNADIGQSYEAYTGVDYSFEGDRIIG